MLTRRGILKAGGLGLAGLLFPRAIVFPARASAGPGVVEIHMRSDTAGAHVAFDPIGLRIEPGQVVRWINDANVHTTTAYHPDNDDHALRIPEEARPWDSGYLVNPGDSFQVTLTVEGVYDYFCAPHEIAGMVGRIVVGRPGNGPGSRPFHYFRNDPAKRHWQAVPPAAQSRLPSVDAIMVQGRVHAT